MNHHIFLSYSRADKALMHQIWQEFEGAEFTVWTDEGIELGTPSWREEIQNAIKSTGCLVCILSPSSANSRWVKEELAFADMHNKPLFLILARGDERESVPFGYATFQWVDIRDMAQYKSQMNELIDIIRKRIVEPEDVTIPSVEKRDRDEDYALIMRVMGSTDRDHLRSAKLLWHAFQQVHGDDFDPEHIQHRLVDVDMPNLPSAPPRVILQEMLEATQNLSPDALLEHLQKQVLAETSRLHNDDTHTNRLIETSSFPKDMLTKIPDPPEIEGTILPPPFQWCHVPSGKVTITLPDGEDRSAYVLQFYMAKYPITTAQFQVFIDDPDGYADEEWWDFSEAAENWRAKNRRPRRATTAHDEPRTNISWYEAVAFCQWLTYRVDLETEIILLPTEQQWQLAAQGDDNRVFPWGNNFDPQYANTRESNIGKPTPVQRYFKGASKYGIYDLCGNVDEWCLTEFISGKNNITGSSSRVLRGGSYKAPAKNSTCRSRSLDGPIGTSPDDGFRVVFTRRLIGVNS